MYEPFNYPCGSFPVHPRLPLDQISGQDRLHMAAPGGFIWYIIYTTIGCCFANDYKLVQCVASALLVLSAHKLIWIIYLTKSYKIQKRS